ncbi:hypothetical protein BJY01DRAFT_250615 [Aspergillus pseudoustus]|uniref:Fungal-specific transcription factor domain-containing protein n=1 Tax=Aspergillus pseudoustus TaxID=1810923 RepID=A0ABR4JGN2_9EURO
MRRNKKPHSPKLLFVNSVDDPQQARLKNRRLVHSHVSQYRWKRSREAVPSNANTRVSGQAEEQHHDPRIVGSPGLTRFLSDQTQDPILSYSDPFFPTQQALNAMSYVSQTMLPGLFLHEKIGQAWVPAAVSDPVLFSACMYGAVVHMLRRLDGHSAESDQRAVWQINNETIRRLHRILDDHARATSDGAIFTVLALAYSAQLQAAPLNTDPHPRRPLQDLQWLTVYSSLPTNLLHVQGLETLVGMRGGLDQIALPGLASLLSYLCMLRASRTLAKPVLPIVPLSDDAHQKLEEMMMTGGHPSSIHPHILNNELFPRMPPNFLQILTQIHQYNEMLAHYLGGSIGAPKMTEFADQRNWIQRAILALPWSDEVEITADTTFSRFEHEMVRVSLLLYSFLVVFPIPFAYGPYDRVLGMLKNILLDEAGLNLLPQSMLLWAVSLGAITSESIASDDAWFVVKLRELTSQGGVMASWNEYKLAVRSVLWQDSVLDPFMQRIWLSHILVF